MGESPRKRARSGDGEEPSLAFFELGEEEDDDALSDDEEVEEVVRIELTAQRTVAADGVADEDEIAEESDEDETLSDDEGGDPVATGAERGGAAADGSSTTSSAEQVVEALREAAQHAAHAVEAMEEVCMPCDQPAGDPRLESEQGAIARAVGAGVNTLVAGLEPLQRQGLPKTERLLCCKSRRCVIFQLYTAEDQLMAVCKEAKRLRDELYERPERAKRFGPGFAALVKRKRHGQRGQVTYKGNAVNRLPRKKKNREKVIALDKFGWFFETRRRRRWAFIEKTLPQLRLAGMCMNACAAVLHCSVSTLYTGGVMEELGLLTKRKAGDRLRPTPLPAFGDLWKTPCKCGGRCNKILSPAMAEDQHRRWSALKTRKERMQFLAYEVLSDRSTGRVSERCADSINVQLGGVSEYAVKRVKGFLQLSLTNHAAQMQMEHGNSRHRPWNRMSEEHEALCLLHMDTWTVSAPDSHIIRPASAAIHSLPDMMEHLLKAHPELAGEIGRTGYKRVIKTFLKAEFKTFMGYASDHNVSLKSIALNLAYNSASVLYKQGKHRYEQLNRQLLSGTLGSATAADVQAAKDIMEERRHALADAQKKLDADALPDIELRSFLAVLFEVVSKLEELHIAADSAADNAQCRILATEVDDKSATELHWLRWRTAGGEPLYYIGENGQMQPATQRGNFYLMPPYANSKDSTTICCELFLDCVRELGNG